MRTKDEVSVRFDEVRQRRLSQRRARFLERGHRNCISNIRMRVKGQGKCGFCRNPEVVKRANGAPFVCDEEGTALRCPFYECRNTPESVERDFEEVLRCPARCGHEYPKLAVLIWFIQHTNGRSRWGRLKGSVVDAISAAWKLVTGRWW